MGPGPLGVSASLLKFLFKIAPKFINKVQNVLFSEGNKTLNKKYFKIIPKPGKKDYNDINNYRPISLINNINKASDKIILNRMIRVFGKNPLVMPDSNFAYRMKVGTADSLHNLIDTLDIIKHNNLSNAGVLSIDFSKAFDLLSHQYMEDYLHHLGCPAEFINYFATNLSNETAIIKGSNQDEINIESGISQGKCSSGLLFVFFSAPTLLRIKKSSILKNIPIMPHSDKVEHNYANELNLLPIVNGFADDNSISVELSCNEEGKSPEIDEIISIYSDFEKTASLILNDSKSVIFSSIESEVINKIAEHYKYENKTHDTLRHLGFYFVPSKHQDNSISISLLESKIAKSINNFKYTSYLGKKILVDSFIVSRLNYSFANLTNPHVNAFHKIQRRIDHYLRPPVAGVSKYMSIEEQGCKTPNVYSRALATITKHYIASISCNEGYHKKINSLFKHIFGYLPYDRILSGTKGLNALINSYKYMGLTRLAQSAKTFSLVLSKSAEYTGHCLLYGSNQDKQILTQPKVLKNLRSKPGESHI